MFRFRLQRVLELREDNEQQAATRLAAARDEADGARAAWATLEAMRDAGAENLARAHSGVSTAGQLQHLSFVIDHLNRQIQEAHHVAETADENVRKLLSEFTVAFQERRVLDLLRERQHGEWKAEAVQADQRLMDSVALSQYVRRPAASEGGRG